MQDDLIDAVNWAVSEGFADPKRVAISGFSYGGYCALAGLAFTPEVFACGVDLWVRRTSKRCSVPPRLTGKHVTNRSVGTSIPVPRRSFELSASER